MEEVWLEKMRQAVYDCWKLVAPTNCEVPFRKGENFNIANTLLIT